MHRSRIVRCRFFCSAAACLVAVASALASRAAAEITPYEARAVASGASVHSGPGEKYYPTDALAEGDVVEVYREKPGGWLGIRPTLNSFSWIPGRDLKLRDGGLAEINQDDVASRIGSRLSDKHNAAQVRLKKGDLVEVLGDENFQGETWYKIAPPAGEFRWIQASLVERIGPIKADSAETPPASPPTADTTNAAVAPAATGAAEPPANDAAAPPLISNTPASNSTSTTAAVAPAANAPVAPAKPQAAELAADDLSDELSAIELRLSRMAAAPVNLWNTERLERDTAQLRNRAQTPAEREAVEATMSKINRFAAIGQRSNPPAANFAMAGAPPSAGSGDPRTTLPVTPLPDTTAAAASGGPYDAVGILRPVVSRRPGAPQFALVDDRGQVLSFVTPTPDINLQPYLGRRVGVVGNRGFITEFNRSHVTAARVMPLVR
jgi:hypothetical protein